MFRHVHRNFALYGLIGIISLILGCSGGGGRSDPPLETLAEVQPLYPENGANWNDYTREGTDAYCGDFECLHGGERRVVEATGKSSCEGLTAADALGAFNWTCDDTTGTARLISTGLKENKNLSDLINFAASGWKANSVKVYVNGAAWGATPSSKWWTNPVTVNNIGGRLATEGKIYIVTEDTSGTAYTIEAEKIGLVVQPGKKIIGPGTGAAVVDAESGGTVSARFVWIEGEVDATGDAYGIKVHGNSLHQVLRNVKADNSNGSGISIFSNYSVLNHVSASNNNGTGIDIFQSHYVDLYRVTANNNGGGVSVSGSTEVDLNWVEASINNGTGVTIFNSYYNIKLSRITASNNSVAGVSVVNPPLSQRYPIIFSRIKVSNNLLSGLRLFSTSYATLSDITASGNERGIEILDSENNTLGRVIASNNQTDGVYLDGGSIYNVFLGVTASNNGFSGVTLDGSENNRFIGLTVSNNSFSGLEVVYGSSSNMFDGVVASNNMFGIRQWTGGGATLYNGVVASNNESGIALLFSSDNRFTGDLKVGDNNLYDCRVDGGTNPGLVNTTCTTSGDYLSGGTGGFGIGNTSDATLYNGITLASSFVGKVTADDTANASDASGAADYPVDPAIFDWLNFENPFRGWGIDGSDFPNADNRGDWTANNGRIWDWSLKASDTAVLNTRALAVDGDDYVWHRWYPFIYDVTFLRNAVELPDDGIGNDDLFCESNETCLYTPNMGSYQGHGSLVSAGYIGTGGQLENITLMKYETNGY